jgi:hypothetical protein
MISTKGVKGVRVRGEGHSDAMLARGFGGSG